MKQIYVNIRVLSVIVCLFALGRQVAAADLGCWEHEFQDSRIAKGLKAAIAPGEGAQAAEDCVATLLWRRLEANHVVLDVKDMESPALFESKKYSFWASRQDGSLYNGFLYVDVSIIQKNADGPDSPHTKCSLANKGVWVENGRCPSKYHAGVALKIMDQQGRVLLEEYN